MISQKTSLSLFMEDFEHHYRQNLTHVYRYLYLRLNDRLIAEDLTSKTFLNALERQHQYDPERGNWQQWVIGIAKNRLIDYWRMEKIPLSLDELQQMEHLLQPKDDLQGQVSRKLMFEELLDQAPKNLRHLLILRYVDDLTYEEIAVLTGKKPASVRKIFSRLHQKLKSHFNSDSLDL